MENIIIQNRYNKLTQRLRILLLQNIREEENYDENFLLEMKRLSTELLSMKKGNGADQRVHETFSLPSVLSLQD